MKWQRNVACHARDVDDRTASLLAHHWNYRLHARERAEEIRFEKIVAGVRVGLRNRVEKTMTGIVDPDIDTLEMMEGQREDAVDLLGMAHIARESNRPFGKADSCSGRLGSRGIARQQDDAGAVGGKFFRDRFADSHRSAGDYDYLSVEFHAGVVFVAARQVKMTSDGVVQSNCFQSRFWRFRDPSSAIST